LHDRHLELQLQLQLRTTEAQRHRGLLWQTDLRSLDHNNIFLWVEARSSAG